MRELGSMGGTSSNDMGLRDSGGRQVCVLVVEDDPALQRMILNYFGENNIRTLVAGGRQQMVRQLGSTEVNLVILDLRLGQEDGLDLLREVRSSSDVPVIIITGHRRDDIDRVVGLELGADDYLTKPFSPQELVLRVGAILRRVKAGRDNSEDIKQIGPLRIDSTEHRVTVDGREIDLTPTEFKLLLLLAERKGRVQPRNLLLEIVWEAAPDIQTRTVDMHVQRLRVKLGHAGDLIETVRGFGYRIRNVSERT
jgi:two-component system phosphate regulon response regulator PhoB